MKLFVGVLGLGLIVLFGLHGVAPVFGFEDGLVQSWMVWLLVAASLPLGVRMAILRHRRKQELREKGARR